MKKTLLQIALRPFVLLLFLCFSYVITAQQDVSQRYVTEGWDLVNQQKYDEAVVAFSNAVNALAESYGGLLGRSFCYSKLDKLDLALADVRKLDQLYPYDQWTNIMTGWYLLLKKQYKESYPHIRLAYDLNPFLFNAVMSMGNYYFLTGNDQKAHEYFLESIACVSNEAEFKDFTSDFDVFIEKGWRVEQSKKEKALLIKEIETNKQMYLKIAGHNLKSIEYQNNKNYQAAINENNQAVSTALSFSPPNYYLAMRYSYFKGYLYELLNQPANAISAYEEAIGYVKKGNIVHRIASDAYNYSGQLYLRDFKYEKAKNNYLEALAIEKKMANDNGIAVLCSNLGEVHNKLGEQQKAIELYEKAIGIQEKLKNEQGLTITYNNLGAVYKDMGKYSKALDLFNKAIELGEKLKHPDLSVFYSMKGNCLLGVGDYEQALVFFNKSYKIDEKQGNRLRMGRRLNSIGATYYNLNKINEAINYLNRAETICKSELDAGTLSNVYNTLGAVYVVKKDYIKAKDYYEKSLAISREISDYQTLAANLTNLAEIYTVYYWEPQKVLNYLNEAEGIYRKMKLNAELAEVLNSKGGIYFSIASSNNNLTNLDKAIANYKESIKIKEELRKNASEDLRMKYLASVIESYELLTAAYIFTGKYTEAFNTLEISRAKSLSEKIAGSADIQPATLSQVQATLASNSTLLYFANSVQNPMSLLVINKSSIKGYHLNKDDLIDNVKPKYGSEIVSIINKQRGFKPVKAETGDGKLNKEQQKSKNELENIINYYRLLLMKPNDASSQSKADQVAQELYKFLIGKISSELVGKEELFIVPDGILAYLPFETLKSQSNKYLVEEFNVRYLHSATVRHLIGKRKYPANRKQLLAFGGAVYSKATPYAKQVNTDEELNVLKQEVDRLITAGKPLDKAYTSLGVGKWSGLPGTLTEIQNIKKLIPDATLVTGNEVSEKKLKSMSATGELTKYKTLHFATHGIVTPEIPKMSALVLSQLSSGSKEDGYITMGEIEALKLKADFVNLSACETGLGKIYGGEGVVGLSQSFLIAGANGLSVSLWQVADESTSGFMSGVYEIKVKATGNSFHQAINEMKKRFIKGDFGDEYKKPYYWAPFVYYGE